jgi:hypothetical protein
MNSDRTFGPAYDRKIDGYRVATQMTLIRDHLLRQRSWLTLRQISLATNQPEASVSAQLRHLRKRRFGGFEVTKRRRAGAGTWEYRLEIPFELTP